MKPISLITALVCLPLAALPAAAQNATPYIAGSGISRADTQTLTLSELAAYKFNHGSDSDEAVTIGVASDPVTVDPVRHAQLIAAAGLTPGAARAMSLDELAAAKADAEARGDDRQPAVASATGAGDHRHLIAAAGLDPAEAKGMSLNDIAAAFFDRSGNQDD